MIRTAFIVLLIALLTVSADQLDFDLWRKKYGRVYSNLGEADYRRQVYEENVAFITAHNSDPRATMLMAVNEFADLTPIEFMASMTTVNEAGNDPCTASSQTVLANADPPKSIDWRDHGAVNPVQSQGSCGGCWAFAAAAALEGAWKIHGGGQLVKVSEQQMIDCSTNKNHGCQGGLPSRALEYLTWEGAMSEKSYPYVGHNSTCDYRKDYVLITPVSTVNLTIGDSASLENSVGLIGPVATAVQTTICWQFYSSGILMADGVHSSSGMSCLGVTCGNSTSDLNHAVTIIGYGTLEKGEEGCPNESCDYWMVRNSWGGGWGDAGYIKIEKGNNTCGIASCSSFPLL